MKLLSSKKAVAMWDMILFGIIALAVVIIILGVIFWPSISKTGVSISSQFDQFGDCDLDGVKNFMDKCPCEHFGAKESKTLRGCQIGINEQEQLFDQKTCSQFVTEEENVFVPNCKNEEYKSKCKNYGEGMSDVYKTRCDLVTETALELPTTQNEGNAGNYDLNLIGLYVFKSIQSETPITESVNIGANIGPGKTINAKDQYSTGKYLVDLENQHEFTGLAVNFEFENSGSLEGSAENINQPFYARFYVCGSDKKNCQPINQYDTWDEKNSYPGFTYDSLEVGKVVSSPKRYIFVGRNGDACDGSNTRTCYVKLVLDSPSPQDNKAQLAEINEDNNEAGFFLIIKNQKYSEHHFMRYSSIEIFGNDDNDLWGPNADPEKKEIYSTCEGFIGYGYCKSEDNDCNNHFPTNFPSNKGCWVFASEDDDSDPNDCGYETGVEGEIISHLAYKKINTLNDYKSFEGESEPKNLFEWQWKAKSEGSLLCKDNEWQLCSSTGEDVNQLLIINDLSYVCQGDGTWKLR